MTTTGTTAAPKAVKKPRKVKYTLGERRRLVERVEQHVCDTNPQKMSIRNACALFGIDPKQYRRWKKDLPTFKKMSNQNACSVHTGPKSRLDAQKGELLQWFEENRNKGLIITYRQLSVRAAQSDADFARLSRQNRWDAAYCFCRKYGIVQRAVTHKSQADPRTKVSLALDFVESMRPRMNKACRDQDYILNMDQTPLFFSMDQGKTLEFKGRKTINGRKSTSGSVRATAMVTISASGKKLPAMFVWKGVAETGGHIKYEFKDMPPEHFYACQPSAWTDARVMNLWLDKVLFPYARTAPEGIQPLLLLDVYTCHIMPSIIERIEEEGIEIEHIPDGCTGLCQPIDVGIGKPLKSNARHLWEDWMISEGSTTAVTKAPSRIQMAHWAKKAYDLISVDTVRNAWRNGSYTYFPLGCEPRPVEEEAPFVDDGGNVWDNNGGYATDDFATAMRDLENELQVPI